MFGMIAIPMILTAASGCDKKEDAAPALPQTSLAGRPNALFLVFGDQADPRALPIAMLAGGKVVPIQLDASGWRGFDGLYFPAGGSLTVYQDGRRSSQAKIRRGMWSRDESPLYKLPACRALRPLAAVTLDSAPVAAVMLELLATSESLGGLAQRPEGTTADLDSARALVARAAKREGLTDAARAELALVARAIGTGATGHATLVASYLEQGSAAASDARHLFVMGDWSDSTHAYQTSFVHVPADSAREFRRLIDHVDLTGDGVDEIVIEGWRTGSDSYLVFLQYAQGRWREIARGATSWCADR